MVINKNVASKTAELLLQIKAIKLSPEEPFTWASGWKSPIYCDNRIVLSFPEIRNYLKEEMAKHIESEYVLTPWFLFGLSISNAWKRMNSSHI